MKKMLIGLVLGIMGFTLVACTPQDNTPQENTAQENVAQDNTVQDTVAETVESVAEEEEIYEGMNMSNPWVDSDQAGVLEATGFDLVAPEEATNVAYSYMPSTGMAQMNYTMENAMWVYRAQPTDALEDISGIYCEWNYTEELKVSGMDGIEYGYASEPEGDFLDDMEYTRVINWYDAQNKVTYSLSVIGTDLNGMDTVVYAENLFGQ